MGERDRENKLGRRRVEFAAGHRPGVIEISEPITLCPSRRSKMLILAAKGGLSQISRGRYKRKETVSDQFRALSHVPFAPAQQWVRQAMIELCHVHGKTISTYDKNVRCKSAAVRATD